MNSRIYTTNRASMAISFGEPAQDFSPTSVDHQASDPDTTTSAERMARAVASRARLIAEQKARASRHANHNSPPTSHGSAAIPDVETARARVIEKLIGSIERNETADEPTTNEASTTARARVIEKLMGSTERNETADVEQSIFYGHYYAEDSSSHSVGNNDRKKSAPVLMTVKNPALDEERSPVASSEPEPRINDRKKPALDEERSPADFARGEAGGRVKPVTDGLSRPVDETSSADAETIPDDVERVNHAPPPKVMHNGVLMTVAERVYAEARAKTEAPIQIFADGFQSPLIHMIKPHWQLFDNRDEIAAYNARMVVEDKRFKNGKKAGHPITSQQSKFTLKLRYQLKERGKWHSRYVNFQDPYFFKGKANVNHINHYYFCERYEKDRKEAVKANNRCRALNQPIEMLGHVELSHKEFHALGKNKNKKTYPYRGSPVLPYNYAHLVWNDGMPVVIFYNGYRGHLLPLVMKSSRSTKKCPQFELYGIE